MRGDGHGDALAKAPPVAATHGDAGNNGATPRGLNVGVSNAGCHKRSSRKSKGGI